MRARSFLLIGRSEGAVLAFFHYHFPDLPVLVVSACTNDWRVAIVVNARQQREARAKAKRDAGK